MGGDDEDEVLVNNRSPPSIASCAWAKNEQPSSYHLFGVTLDVFRVHTAAKSHIFSSLTFAFAVLRARRQR